MYWIILLLIFIFLILIYMNNYSVETLDNINVKISNYKYIPNDLTISPNTKVTWANEDIVGHTVTSNEGEFLKSELLGKGDKYSQVFEQKGNYKYYCVPHPWMSGQVTVS